MADLKIPPKKAILLLSERISDLKTVREKHDGSVYYNFVGWCSRTWPVIDGIYGSDDIHSEEIRSIGLPGCSCTSLADAQTVAGIYQSRLLEYIDEIQRSITAPE